MILLKYIYEFDSSLEEGTLVSIQNNFEMGFWI